MEAKPYQTALPEPFSPARTLPAGKKDRSPSSLTTKEKRDKYYSLVGGTTLRSGPLGGTGEVLGWLEKRATAKVLRKIVIDGNVSFWVEIESPPEQKGRRYWVTKRFGRSKGFL